MEAWIWELKKAPQTKEVIDVDSAVENTMVVFSAIESLRTDTEEGWKKMAEAHVDAVITDDPAGLLDWLRAQTPPLHP